MTKNPHSRILKGEPKEQHLSTEPKSCPFIIYTCVCVCVYVCVCVRVCVCVCVRFRI